MEEIILVTGCDCTGSWTNVAFLGGHVNAKGSYGVRTVEGTDNSVQIQFSPGHVAGGVLSHGPQGTVRSAGALFTCQRI
jgi:prepilin-type processing-associated H-X9-DG protein